MRCLGTFLQIPGFFYHHSYRKSHSPINIVGKRAPWWTGNSVLCECNKHCYSLAEINLLYAFLSVYFTRARTNVFYKNQLQWVSNNLCFTIKLHEWLRDFIFIEIDIYGFVSINVWIGCQHLMKNNVDAICILHSRM